MGVMGVRGGNRLGTHLRRLVIHRFRNVLPETELVFHPGINVVLGKNGSGKTTLLKVFEAVLSGDFELLWREEASVTAEFEVEWQELPAGPLGTRRIGQTTLFYASERRALGETKRSERLDICIQRSDGILAEFRYSGGEVILEESGRSSRYPAREMEGDVFRSRFSAPLQETWVSRWAGAAFPFGSTQRFAEDLSDFVELMRSEITVEAHSPGTSSITYTTTHAYALRLPPFLGTPPPRQITLKDTSIHDASERMGFQGAEVTMRAGDTAAKPVVYGSLAISLQRKDGSWVQEEKLSWGQKRFLAWWATRPDRYVIADELTNGLHHEWIRLVLEGMEGRQAFLATQNPLLLDHLEFEGAEEVRQRIAHCRSLMRDGREVLEWRNPTSEEAGRFFEAYQQGIQHVSQILQLEDLW
jgi:energy-coupling factor transporter ATP-binding protein EcfA2